MILVLSSDAEDCDALVDMFRSEGYRTRGARTPSDANAAATKQRPSLRVTADETSITLSSANGTCALRRPFAREALLSRVVHALAVDGRRARVQQAPIAIAC